MTARSPADPRHTNPIQSTHPLQPLHHHQPKKHTGTLKLRCRSEDQAAEWRRALLDWRAHCVAYKQGALPAVYHAATAAAAADETHDAATSSLNALSDLASALGAKAAVVVPPSVTSIFGGAAASAAATTTAAGGSVVRGGHKKPVMPNILSGRLQLQSGLFGQLAEKSFAVKPTDGTLKHYKVRTCMLSPRAYFA